MQKRMTVLALCLWFLTTTVVGQNTLHIISIRENRGPDSLVNDSETGQSRTPTSENRFRIKSENVMLIKLNKPTKVDETNDDTKKQTANLVVFPNPANAGTTIQVYSPATAGGSLLLYNFRGQVEQKLFSGQWQAGRHRFILSGNQLSSGVYFVRLEIDYTCKHVKFILLR